jgi:tRNA threonylcarbamoyladenosine biosynthesis protein TsaB
MALILSIDVSGPKGLIILSEDDNLIDTRLNNEPMQHAAFLQPAVKDMLKANSKHISQVEAVAISNGPGSYTGLRVGLASAKGLCYTLGIPLITISSLQLLAQATCEETNYDLNNINANSRLVQYFSSQLVAINLTNPESCLICPMLDARRMEVFFALYDRTMSQVTEPASAIVDETFLGSWLVDHSIIFTGTGAEKWQTVCTHKNAYFFAEPELTLAFMHLSHRFFLSKQFADLPLAEPYYCKSFHDNRVLQTNKGS